jgi:hypothetical protein
MALIWDPSTEQARQASLAEAETRFLRERAGVDRKERLAAWREWAAKKLIAELALPEAPGARERLVGQLIAELERLVRALFDRGWLIEGRRLRDVVSAFLAPIATQQRAGKIGDFYPYFVAARRRFVGVNAEELQQAARQDGADAGTAFAGGLAMALGMLQALGQPSLTEVIAERRQDRCNVSAGPVRRGPGRPRKDTGAGTGDLFGAP